MFMSRVQYDSDDNKLNPLKIKDVENSDIKTLAAKLQQIDENTNTHGEYFSIGKLYGFKLLVKTAQSGKTEEKDGIFREVKENHYFAEGEGNIKYKYHNACLSKNPKAAVAYFIRALETMPSLIESYEKKNQQLSVDIPVLEEIAKSVWKKEEELKELKSELDAVDRKIQLSLAPSESPQPPLGGLTGGIDENRQKNRQVQSQSPFSHSERLKGYRDVMGDRVVVGSVPKMGEEKRMGGVKM